MKKLHKSLAGAVIGLVCTNGAMAASCDMVSNADGLSAILKVFGFGTGAATSLVVAPVAGLIAGPLGVTAVSIGGGYLGAKLASKVYTKQDYICFDEKGKKCLQCDIHQYGRAYECNEGKVVIAPGIQMRCNTRIIGADRWERFSIPLCAGATQLTGEKGSVEAELTSRLRKNFADKGLPNVWVTEDDVCYTYKCAKSYEEKDGKCVKKGTTPPGPGQDGISEQKCYDRGGIPMTNGNCRCPDGEWYSEKAKHCTPKNGCGDCKGGVFIIADNGSVVIVGDNNNVNNGGNNNTYNGGGSSSLQKCLAEPVRQGKPELLACCYLPKTGSNGAKPDFTNGKCVCNDPSKKFSIRTDGRGQCLAGNGPVPPQPGVTCPDNMYAASDGSCKCRASFQDPIKEKLKICECGVPDAHNDASGNCVCNDSKKTVVEDGNGGGKCEVKGPQCDPATQVADGDKCKCIATDAYIENGICKCNNKDMVLKDNKCVMDESKIAEIRGRITATFSRLSSTMGGFEKSVWKNAEGEFNTARLASDSIAGVVLGTAGGIITSKLVKKNQLKTGFEDIKCSIGGQTVASYGDTFTVGM